MTEFKIRVPKDSEILDDPENEEIFGDERVNENYIRLLKNIHKYHKRKLEVRNKIEEDRTNMDTIGIEIKEKIRKMEIENIEKYIKAREEIEKEMEEKYEEEMSKLKRKVEEYKDKINNNEIDIEMMRDEINEKNKKVKEIEMEKKYREIKIEEEIQIRIKEKEKREKEEEEVRKNKIEEMMEYFKGLYEEVKKELVEKNKEISRINDINIEKRIITTASHTKGAKGEQDFYKIFLEQINKTNNKRLFEIEDTHMKKGQGDFKVIYTYGENPMENNNLNILIDVKAHHKGRAVPMSDLTKIMNDADNDIKINCGLLICMDSMVSSIHHNYWIEFSNNGKPILIVRQFLEDVDFLIPCCELLASIHKSVSRYGNKEYIQMVKIVCGDIKDKATSISSLLNKTRKDIETSLKSVKESQHQCKIMNEILDSLSYKNDKDNNERKEEDIIINEKIDTIENEKIEKIINNIDNDNIDNDNIDNDKIDIDNIDNIDIDNNVENKNIDINSTSGDISLLKYTCYTFNNALPLKNKRGPKKGYKNKTYHN